MTTYPTAPPALPVSGAPNNWLSTWTAGSTLTGSSTKNNQLSANAGSITLVGGPLDDTFIAYDPWTTVVGNGGTDTVETWGSGYKLPTGIANLYLEGGNNATATGNAGNNIILGNAGTDLIAGGGGNDILKAGTGADTFVVAAQANAVSWIEGFKAAGTVIDKIDLTGFGFQSFSAVQAAMVQSGTNVALNLANGEVLMLQNQSVSSLTASNFLGVPVGGSTSSSTAAPTPPPSPTPMPMPPAGSAPPPLPTGGALN